jgi:hypothetical protein
MPTKQWAKDHPDEMRAARRKWYYANKEKQAHYRKGRDAELAAWLQAKKSELVCACGESHIACLEFHHRDPKQKTITIAKAIVNGWSVARIEDEMAKCDVLCANCHRKLHYGQRFGLLV